MNLLTSSTLRLIAVGTLAALPLSGCGNEAGQARNEAQKQLEDSSKDIQAFALKSSYPTPMTDEQSAALSQLASQPGDLPEGISEAQAQQLSSLGASGYKPLDNAQEEISTIQKKLAGGGAGQSLNEQKSAKAALRAEAGLSLARLRLEEASRTDARLQQAVSLASAHIDAVLELAALVKANASYDPSAALREIDDQAQDARTRLSRYQAQVQETQKRISDLQSRIDSEVQQTNKLGEQAARQREEALGSPLDVRISRIEAAADVARKADSHQVQAARLESELDVLKPELVRAQTFVLQAEGELKDLEAARGRIENRRKAVAAEGTQLRSDLKKATEEFNAVFAPLSEQFESELMSQYDAAREAAETALTDARASGAQGGRTAKTQQALGQVLWREAMSIESFAQLLHRVAENGESLDRGGQDAAAADALDARAQEARDAAEAALKEALDSIPQSGRSEDETASNKQLASMIRDSLEYITGRAVAEVRDLADLPEAPTVTTPEPVDTGDSPLGLLQRGEQILKSGRLGEIPSLVRANTPGGQATIEMLKRILTPLGRLDDAARSQFGVGIVDIVSDPKFEQEMNRLTGEQSIPMDTSSMSEFADLEDLDLESIEFSYDTSRTTAWTDSVPALEGLDFIKVDGQWYIQAPEMPEGSDEAGNAVLDLFASAIDSVATRTNNGEFVDQWVMISALTDELAKKMQEMFQNMMPEGMNPGGVGRQRNRGGGN